jgi:multidrug resistance efflux pump
MSPETPRPSRALAAAALLLTLAVGAGAGYLAVSGADAVASQSALVVGPDATIAAPAAGDLTGLDVSMGQTVRAGQVVAVVAAAAGRLAVRASRRGKVTAVYVALGQPVAVGTPLLQVAEPGPLEVRALVPEDEVDRIEVGASATLRFDAYGGRTFSGRVRQIAPVTAAALAPAVSSAPAAETYIKTAQMIPVFISIVDPPAGLVPGESAQASITATAVPGP